MASATCTEPGHVHAPAAGRVEVDLRPLRFLGIVMFVGAFALPLLPLDGPVLCPLRRFTGVPCPFCGMTRGVVALAHGDLFSSLTFNPGAVVVVALVIAVLVAWRVQRVFLPTWTIFSFFVLLWAYQLFKYTTDRPL
jgi:hypothetical protein